jgi:hypothetical protein
MTTTHDNATTWRELASELTDHQRSSIARIEEELAGRIAPEQLLQFARDHIESDLANNAYSDVPAPAGTTWIGDWEKNLKRDGWSRSLVWRKFGDSNVHIDGTQQCDGTYTCEISLYAAADDQTNLDAASARRLAAVLLDAADELDGLGL